MANIPNRSPRNDPRRRTVEKGAVEARQGFLGRPVLWVLVSSLGLAVAAYLILYSYFFGK